MNDLREFSALQARVYDFLAQQDEATLQGIVRGPVRLTTLPNGDDVQAPASSATRERVAIAPRPASIGRTVTPSGDPYQVAQDLARLTSENERRVYLNATGLTTKPLQRVAKLLGLRHYSRLTKPEVIALLAGHGSNHTDAVVVAPKSPEPPSPEVVHNEPAEDERLTAARPSPVAPPTDAAQGDVDAAAVAAHLRDIETEEEGAAYLRAQRLDRKGLLAVAAELQLTRVDRLKPSELEKRVLKQAIGARRKFAGLRKW